MNSRILSSGRLAVLTMSMVLSASAVLAQVNDVRGSISGHDLGVVQGGTLQAAGGGEGTASRIGRFTYTAQATVDPTGDSIGVFLLVFFNGDVIYGSFSGHGDQTTGHIVEHLTINGGTGRFQGAIGSLTFDRLEDLSTLPFFAATSGTVSGTISIPK